MVFVFELDEKLLGEIEKDITIIAFAPEKLI
jgi:hypothetical protein